MSDRARPDVDVPHYVGLVTDALNKWARSTMVPACYRCKATPEVRPTDIVPVLDEGGGLSKFAVRGHDTLDKDWGTLRWKEKDGETDHNGNPRDKDHRVPLCPDCVNMNRFEAGDPTDG